MNWTWLAVIERAYRGMVEDQYGHVLWMYFAKNLLGLKVDLLLRRNAVLYARKAQTPPVLRVASVQSHEIDHEAMMARILARGVRVYVCARDLAFFGLAPHDLCPGVEVIADDAGLAAVFRAHDRVWFG